MWERTRDYIVFCIAHVMHLYPVVEITNSLHVVILVCVTMS